MLSIVVVSYKVASVSKNEQTKENLKNFARMLHLFFFFLFFFSPKGTLWDTKWGRWWPPSCWWWLNMAPQYYQCGNVCPIAILERYFSSVRWRFWQWKSEAISKSSFQESWGSIQAFFTPSERFLFFCWALDLTNTCFSEWESKLLVDSVICFFPDKPLLFSPQFSVRSFLRFTRCAFGCLR